MHGSSICKCLGDAILSAAFSRNAVALFFSGTYPSSAVIVRASTHTGPNYIVPLSAETHDPECAGDCPSTHTAQRMTVAAKREQRNTIGYYTGYIQKRQPVGQFELKQATLNLRYLAKIISADRTRSSATTWRAECLGVWNIVATYALRWRTLIWLATTMARTSCVRNSSGHHTRIVDTGMSMHTFNNLVYACGFIHANTRAFLRPVCRS